jgi:hypothetical protein
MTDDDLLARVLAETRGPSVCWNTQTRGAWQVRQPIPPPPTFDDSPLTVARRRKELERAFAEHARLHGKEEPQCASQ